MIAPWRIIQGGEDQEEEQTNKHNQGYNIIRIADPDKKLRP